MFYLPWNTYFVAEKELLFSELYPLLQVVFSSLVNIGSRSLNSSPPQ